MSLDRGVPPSPIVVLMPIAVADETGIAAAIGLGNRARATLGHMPFAGYREAASNGTLLGAYAGEQLVGYALYGLTRRRVRLTHLCVATEWRGRGTARLLVDWISAQHADYPGILAKCRFDFGLGPTWIRLGFAQISERPGRSKAGHILVSWWRDHHHPNLFTRDDDSVLVRAAIDLNVLRDMDDAQRSGADESQALVSDQVADRLELVRTAALDAEIDSIEGLLRAQLTTRAEHLHSLRADGARVAQINADLLAAARTVEPGYPRSDQDRFDLAHVAEASAVGLNVFVTRDEHLTRILGPAAQKDHGLRILRPADVVVHIDELARAEAYRPAALLGTSYRRQLIGVGHDTDLRSLINQRAGESPREIQKTIRNLVVGGYERTGIYTPDGGIVAGLATSRNATELTTPFFRVANTGVADTLARQLLFQLRQQAHRDGATIVRVSDRHLSTQVRIAVIGDGFYQDENGYYAYVIDGCGLAAEVEQQAVIAARQMGVPEPAPLRSGMAAILAAEIERTWWPAKIIDSELPTYLIPIRQSYSTDLLGVPESLLPRDDGLGLAREHVYYRSPGGLTLHAPARVLWYMSSGGRNVAYPSAVVACSQLDLVATGNPRDLHSRFRHLGVWSEGQLYEVARNGLVQALRFTNTELLTHIPRQRLATLAASHGQSGLPPQGPLRISADLFAALYQEGRPR